MVQSSVFSASYNNWKKEDPNLKIGDVCLARYEHKLGKADFRICKVEKDLVRTVMVDMRPRDSREKSLPYKSKKMRTMKLAVQRLVLICPAQEAKDILKAKGAKNLSGNRINYDAIINGKFVLLSEEGG